MDQIILISKILRSLVGKLPETEEVLKDYLMIVACNLEQRFNLRAQNYYSKKHASKY